MAEAGSAAGLDGAPPVVLSPLYQEVNGLVLGTWPNNIHRRNDEMVNYSREVNLSVFVHVVYYSKELTNCNGIKQRHESLVYFSKGQKITVSCSKFSLETIIIQHIVSQIVTYF